MKILIFRKEKWYSLKFKSNTEKKGFKPFPFELIEVKDTTTLKNLKTSKDCKAAMACIDDKKKVLKMKEEAVKAKAVKDVVELKR